MVNAFRAGTVVAIVAGLVGWSTVLRRQTFAGHTLAATDPARPAPCLLGVSASYGMFAFAVVAALLIALVPGAGGRGRSDESAVTGTRRSRRVRFLFAALHGGFLKARTPCSAASPASPPARSRRCSSWASSPSPCSPSSAGRSSSRPSTPAAAARTVPVGALGRVPRPARRRGGRGEPDHRDVARVRVALVVPAATAQLFTTRPAFSLALTVVVGLLVTWTALFVAYYWDQPIGFLLTSIAARLYLLAVLGRRIGPRLDRRDEVIAVFTSFMQHVPRGILIAALAGLVATSWCCAVRCSVPTR